MMSALIRFASLNPYWYVPPDLAAERIAPKAVKQGLGYLEGSPMTGSSFWAITGSIVAGLGVGFVLAGLKKRE